MPYRVPKGNNRLQKPPCGVALNQSDPLARMIKGAYLLNEGGGAKVTNYAHPYNGVSATPTITWGKGYGSSSAYKGNGSSTYVSLGNSSTNPNLNIPGEMTILSMINLTNTSALGSICTDGASGYQWIFEANRVAGKISVGWTNNLFVYSTATLTAGPWYSIGMTRSLSGSTYTAKTFINGLFDNSGTTTTVPSAQQGSWIGRLSTSGQYFSGTIEYVYIWNRVLTDSEILTVHERPYRMFTPQLRKIFGVGVVLPVGGVVLGGTSANTEFYNSIVVTGSGICGGISTISLNHKNIDATGGSLASGTSVLLKFINQSGVGGSICGGTAELDFNDTMSEIGSGGSIGGGASTIVRLIPKLALGGIVNGGTSSVASTYQLLRITNTAVVGGISSKNCHLFLNTSGRCWLSGTSDVQAPTLESLLPKFGTLIVEVTSEAPAAPTTSINLKKKALSRMTAGRFPVTSGNLPITIFEKD